MTAFPAAVLRWCLAVVVALVGVVALAGPAAAAEVEITITREGVSPQEVVVRSGDRVVFVNTDRTFAYEPRSTSDNWEFAGRVGRAGLLSGTPSRYTVEDPITVAGSYTFSVSDTGPEFSGRVVLPAPPGSTPPPAPAPAPAPGQPAPAPGAPAPGPEEPAPAPSPTGGAGSTALPPLTGGFGQVQPTPGGDGQALAPELAPLLPPAPLPGEPLTPQPETAPVPAASPLVALPTGSLPGSETRRPLGLPAVLALTSAAGVLSLIARVLLAEPAAARRRPAFALGAVATVD